MQRSLLAEVDKNLNIRAAEVKRLLTASRIEEPSQLSRLHLEDSSEFPDVYTDILAATGDVLWSSAHTRPLPQLLPQALNNAERGLKTIEVEPRLRRLLTDHPLPTGEVVSILVAEPLDQLDAALRASISRSVALGLFILCLTELVGSWAFKGVFKPLDELVATAESIVSVEDVTQRVPIQEKSEDEIRRTAIAFNSLMDRVEELLAMARRLLADTSHELRNPLTVLMADLDLLRQDLEEQEREEVITEAQATVTRMSRLVSDLLLLARTEAHSEAATLERIEVADFVERVVNRLAQSLEGGEWVRFEPNPESESEICLFDSERTEQILTNLIENAIRYAPGAPVVVSVGLDHCNGRIAISVRDHGCGIPPAERVRIFERFYRIDRSRHRHSGGTGLGLPLARALARSQNGDVELRPQCEQGAEFVLYLPTVKTSCYRNRARRNRLP